MVDARRRLNGLSLAVLSCIAERPMHPYEISSTLRERGKHGSIKLNFGSLYTAVESLAKRGLLESVETVREGRRPERTVYRITPSGRDALHDSMAELVRAPEKEFLKFEAALSLLPVLDPDEATKLLRERRTLLEMQVRSHRSAIDVAEEMGLPRLLYLESEYYLALLQAERDFVDEVLVELEKGTLDGLDGWRRIRARFAADPDAAFDPAAELDLHKRGGAPE